MEKRRKKPGTWRDSNPQPQEFYSACVCSTAEPLPLPKIRVLCFIALAPGRFFSLAPAAFKSAFQIFWSCKKKLRQGRYRKQITVIIVREAAQASTKNTLDAKKVFEKRINPRNMIVCFSSLCLPVRDEASLKFEVRAKLELPLVSFIRAWAPQFKIIYCIYAIPSFHIFQAYSKIAEISRGG